MTIPPKDPKPITTCPTCKSPVRVDRLEKHIRTQHTAIPSSASRRLPVKEVKCPYCMWTDYSNELPSHIRLSHPMRYAAWSRENQKPAKPVPESKRQVIKTKVKKAGNREEHPTKVKCPICFGEVNKLKYVQHLAKAHEDKSISEYPPIPIFITIIREQESATTTVTSIRRAAGGVKQPIAMNTLNVGRRSKGYIKRK